MCDENEIIQLVLTGYTDRFRLIVERYQNPVRSMVRNFFSNGNLSEDIAQEVFLAAYKNLSSFDQSRCTFSTWLFTITKYKCINVLRKKKPITAESLPERAATPNPTENLENEEFHARLDTELDNLPIKYKTIFILAEFQNQTYQQIAQIEAIKIGTVRSRLHRAKQMLAHALKDLQGDIR
ncbi:MAG: sigma-70 family RNA polymerase sigma factor [Anaerohalosphaera sp.]|nr:sigma-70 family RNA polymerase sigma factor [Anaerohalosphaera sp.]